MDTPNWQKVETILDTLLELPEERRQSYLKEVCGEDQELKEQVIALMDSISESDGWLEEPETYIGEFYRELSEDANLLTLEDELIGKRVGSYTITEKIGEGGMGMVYLAERSGDRFDHRVAIKLIRRAQATDDNLRRFTREQQILAGLNHPGIARLFDGGVTEDGYPYIIMEYVDGIPIDRYCRLHQCPLSRRIELVQEVLEAVQYAHENLVIHRDLKPGNILVNSEGEIKILDFGISKLLDEGSSPDLTVTGERLLTPRYAAPEQIRQQNITTATDLYAIGILLYELLAGKGPYDLKNRSRFDIEQTILEQSPSPPSAATEELSLGEAVTPELDAITMKAIRKRPSDRYRSANALLEDMERYREGFPVTAMEGTLRYRASAFIRRNRKGVAMAVAIVMMTVLFSVFYTLQITRERDQARLQAERAEEITQFLVTILKQNNPNSSAGEEISVREALRRGMESADRREISPHNRAIILGTIGSIQMNIGDIEQAGETLKRSMQLVTDSLGELTQNTLSNGTEYAEWLRKTGKQEQAAAYYQETDSLFRAHNLVQTPEYRSHQMNYSDYLNETGRYEQALQLLNKAETMFPDLRESSDNTLVEHWAYLYNNRARAFRNLGEYDQAIQNYQRALSLNQTIYGPDNPQVGLIYHNLSVAYSSTDRFREALDLAQKAYRIRLGALGPGHQLVGSTLYNLGYLAFQLGRYRQSLDYLDQARPIMREKHGEGHIRFVIVNRTAAEALIELGRYQKAEQYLVSAEAAVAETYGRDHLYYGYIESTMGALHEELNNLPLAERYLKSASQIYSTHLGEEHPNVGRLETHRGRVAFKQDKIRKADSLLNRAREILESSLGSDHSDIREADSLLSVIKQSGHANR